MRLAIIGNGVAGTTTARWVAERDAAVDITVYSDEAYSYYPRPRLIDLLAGRISAEDMALYPESWYAERRIRTRLGCRVVGLVPAAHQLRLPDGESVSYDQLVLAVGARCAVPPIPGANSAGVFTLRTLRDGLMLREEVLRAHRAVVLGGGLLGLDTAGALSATGMRVFVVELLPWLLPRQLDAEGAGLLQGLLARRGIEVLVGQCCARIEGEGRAERVLLQNGQALETDLVVISAGIQPSTELAKSAGLVCGRGVVVDEHLRTSVPDIFALGDVAEFRQRTWGIIPAALAQARVVAAAVTGDFTATYQDIVPSTTLKVTGIDLTSIGEVNPQDDGALQVRYQDPGAGIYRKLVLRQGRVVGAIVLGDTRAARSAAQLVERRIDVSSHLESLGRESVDLADLLRVPQPQ